MSTLQHYLKLVDRLLDHCRAHLKRGEWEAFTRRLASTPVDQGSRMEEPWTPLEYVHYYWRRLSPQERRAFLRGQRQPRRRKREEVAP